MHFLLWIVLSLAVRAQSTSEVSSWPAPKAYAPPPEPDRAYQPGVLPLTPVTPCRVLDTRNAAGPFGGPAMAADEERSVAIPSGACGIPTTALAYSVNVTVVPAGALGYLSVWPTGQTRPVVSTLNSPDGDVVANAALVPAGAGGAISVFVTNQTHVIIDINGFFDTTPRSNSLPFYSVTPCRIVDTRAGQGKSGAFGPPQLSGGLVRSFPITTSSCSIPTNAAAYSLNVTVVPPGPLGYLTVWPAGVAQPLVSTLNSPRGSVVANAAIVPAGTGGNISVFATNSTDLVIDINGYFAP